MNDLTTAINEKLGELERYHEFLQVQIENRKKYEDVLNGFVRPDFDLEKMFIYMKRMPTKTRLYNF